MKQSKIVDINGKPFASSYDGAGSGFGGELGNWFASNAMADHHILPAKNVADARASDLARNHPMAAGGIQSAIDNIVGDNYKLSAKPNYRALGITAEQAREFAQSVESLWSQYSEDERCYLDAERKRTFTMMIRASIENHKRTGEVMASAEWIQSPGSRFRTAIKLVNPSRVCNPDYKQDSNSLRGGISINKHGAAVAYHVKTVDYSQTYGMIGFSGTWKTISRETKWGRAQFIHVFEPFEDGQTRALTSFVSVLSRLKMLDKYQSTKLQNAIIGATYAAAIESELDSKSAFELIGEGQGGATKIAEWMEVVANYHQGANVRFNGVKIPHLMPGEKIHLNSPGNVDNGYSDYESSLLRGVAAGLGISYEQLSKDYSQVSYSSAMASNNESWRHNRGQKKVIADRFANAIYMLWLDEAISSGQIKLPNNLGYYDFLNNKSAWSRAQWIGAGRAYIDGLKGVKEAIEKIRAGLSTYEKEFALMGEDYLEMFDQQHREMEELKERGLRKPIWDEEQQFGIEVKEQDKSEDEKDKTNATTKSSSSENT